MNKLVHQYKCPIYRIEWDKRINRRKMMSTVSIQSQTNEIQNFQKFLCTILKDSPMFSWDSWALFRRLFMFISVFLVRKRIAVNPWEFSYILDDSFVLWKDSWRHFFCYPSFNWSTILESLVVFGRACCSRFFVSFFHSWRCFMYHRKFISHDI